MHCSTQLGIYEYIGIYRTPEDEFLLCKYNYFVYTAKIQLTLLKSAIALYSL